MIKAMLNKILPPKEKAFFALFEASAQTCCECASLLLETVNNKLTDENISRARSLKKASNNIMQQVLTTLHHSYITPIDREDIQAISTNLNNVTKKTTKSILLLNTYQLPKYTDYLKQQAVILTDAANKQLMMINKFKDFKKTRTITEACKQMKDLESKGDDVLYHAMLDLFSNGYDTLTVIKLKDVYNNIEKALDICFSVAELLVNVSLKHT